MKRFWKSAAVAQQDDGHFIELDGRPVKTPLRNRLLLPGRALADAICAEWNGVQEMINPAKMPMTGFANLAIDRVAVDRESYIANIAAYGEADAFCYRADEQEELASRQADIWDPWILWAERKYGCRMQLVAGIIHQPQPAETLLNLRDAVAIHNEFDLAAMAKLVHLSGSLIATLALANEEGDAESLWNASCLDEDWQAEMWGSDFFAEKNRSDRKAEFMEAARFLKLARAG